MLKCKRCESSFESDFAEFFKEIVCPNCNKNEKDENKKVIDLTYKLHPEWKGNGIEHP